MTGNAVESMDTGAADQAPPPGTAIVRPLRHVCAVRARYLLRFADPAETAASRSARAWAWALGETTVAPVTDQVTDAPPSLSQIEAEIAVADDRRLRGGREDRADAAATALRWLIGEDDHVPVRGDNVGELVGGFGDVVRSREEIVRRRADASAAGELATARGRDPALDQDCRQHAQEAADYLDGVAQTLAWVVGELTGAPISHKSYTGETNTRDLNAERLQAEDVVEQSRNPWMRDRVPPVHYGQGVSSAISWLLGDANRIASPEYT